MHKPAYFLALALTVVLAVPAFAAVENVKLNGDITVRGIYKANTSLGGLEPNDSFNGTVFNPADDDQRFFMSQVRLRTTADLTDHVSGEIELLNQRDVDPPSGGGQGSGLASQTNVGLGAAPSAANDQFDVILNLANITLKELYYPELSVKIGRQNIQWGEGFIIGHQQLGNPDPSNTIAADEFSLFNSFDAIRVMIDKDPWHVDIVGMKIQENSVDSGDDEHSFGINVGRAFDSYQSEGEVYFLGSVNENRANTVGDTFTTNEELWTIGTRGSIRPWDRLKLSGETAFQWGEEGGVSATVLSPFNLNGTRRQDIRAFAFDFRGEWNWLESPWPATLGAEWVFYSGEEDSEDGKSGNWRPLHRGKFHSAIREFQGQFYLTDVPVTAGFTNQHQVMFDAAFHPFNNKDLTFFSRWLLYWLDEIPLSGRGRFVGNELDMTFAYDYTEDLKFKLIGAFFFPGDYFRTEAETSTLAAQVVRQSTEVSKLVSAEVVLTF